MTIEQIEKEKLVVYKYIRGSYLYGTNIEGSDIDTSGIFILPIEKILGFDEYYEDMASDEKSDNTYYEIKKWLKLLYSSNPTALESLYIPKNKIIVEAHPCIQKIIENRDLFLTKECFKTFFGYAKEQISKCRGLNKKINNPIYERKNVLDFCYTFNNQGSIKMKKWLDYYGLKQEYCGLVSIPNIKDVYGVYYDYGMHKANKEEIKENCKNIFDNLEGTSAILGYKGIIKYKDEENKINESNEIRLSSVDKNSKPICFMYYNKDGYIKHCKDYKDYKEWQKKRNSIRYESNLMKNYDSKNVMHSIRLMHMVYEIAKGEGFNVDRTNIDREFLINIRNHKYEYDFIIDYLENFKIKMIKAMNESKLPSSINKDEINNLLIEIRKSFIK